RIPLRVRTRRSEAAHRCRGIASSEHPFFCYEKSTSFTADQARILGGDSRWKEEPNLIRMQSFSLADRVNGTGGRVGPSTRRAFSQPTYKNCSITAQKSSCSRGE